MKMSDVLHSIADMLDKQQSDRPDNSIEPGSKILNPENNPTEHGGAGDVEVGVMIPPLQQKLEILKKSVGMDNAMDDSGDELDDIKKLTGVKAVIGHIAGEDNDITG
jgi:hypothetical protein